MAAMSSSLPDCAHDAVLWWQAYQLAEAGHADELTARTAAGDDHARRQLAAWLAERRRTAEAVAVIRPLADAGDDVARLWLARWLAELDDAEDLRKRAAAGDCHALTELARWLSRHERRDELRDLIAGSWPELASWIAGQHDMRVLQLAAELGDDDARQRLDRWLARSRDRAAHGQHPAEHVLADWGALDC
jgi:hypothetical protein